MNEKHEQLVSQFHKAVTMPAHALAEWLAEHPQVGSSEHQRTEREMGNAVLGILRMKPAEYAEADYKWMETAVAVIHRRMAHRPKGDAEEAQWRHSLMNMGRDPIN